MQRLRASASAANHQQSHYPINYSAYLLQSLSSVDHPGFLLMGCRFQTTMYRPHSTCPHYFPGPRSLHQTLAIVEPGLSAAVACLLGGGARRGCQPTEEPECTESGQRSPRRAGVYRIGTAITTDTNHTSVHTRMRSHAHALRVHGPVNQTVPRLALGRRY